jgi:glycosyltransferase involved in cell wall biosynthesis
MEKIIFFDTSNGGHHLTYNRVVMRGYLESSNFRDSEVYYYSPIKDIKEGENLSKQGIKVIKNETKSQNLNKNLDRFLFFIKLIKFARKNNIKNIHLFYLDSLYIPVLIFFPYLCSVNLTATLHWYPEKRLKKLLLGLFLNTKVIKKIVIHGEYTKKKLLNLNYSRNNERITSIVYPNLHPTKLNTLGLGNITDKLNKSKRPYILAFGGLRHDKGIDILLESLSFVKEEYTLIIAGAESYFTEADLKKLIDKYHLGENVFMDIQFISDEKLSIYFEIADIIVLPYRKYFLGQSGPLTEGVTRSKIIIGPNIGEIGFTINKYGLGATFDVENVRDLSDVLRYAIKNHELIKREIRSNQKKYQKLLHVDNFIDQYNSFLKFHKSKK